MSDDVSRLIGLLEVALNTLASAQQQQGVLIAQMQAGTAVSAPAPAPIAAPAPTVTVEAEAGRTLGDWLTVFDGLLTERGYKAQTMKNRRANVAHVRRLWGSVQVRALKPHAVSAALKEFLPARSSTARRVLAELRDVYSEAIANGEAETNPAAHVKMPASKVKRERLTFAVWQSMRTLAQAGPQRWVESLLLLAIATGQRRGDLAKMKFSDVVTDDAGMQFLRIEQQKEAGKGYGARVEIPLALRLDCIGMTVGEVIEHCRSSAKPGPMLLRKAGGGSIEESSLSARFHECIRAALGDEAHAEHEWPSLHEVRSLAARTYLDQGLDMLTVQTLLGHKHAEMTQLYVDDRGLSAKTWKRVAVRPPAEAQA